MTTRVYQFGCLAPTEGLDVVRAQLRSAHDFRNDLVAIERGRRAALRALEESPAVYEALQALASAPKPERVAALRALASARKAARDARQDDLARIQACDHQIRTDARNLSPCYWGNYLDVEKSNEQARKAPLYDDDAVTPRDPSFLRWHRDRPMPGHVGIQIQSTRPLTTADALAGGDTRVRFLLRDKAKGYGTLWLRVGSEGRAPIWAKIPARFDRAIPDAALWDWVRVTVSVVAGRERWSCEITVTDQAPPARSLDRALTGAIAIAWDWTPLPDGRIQIAHWKDTRGQAGAETLAARVPEGLAKAEKLQSLRDKLADELRPALARLLAETPDPLPPWLFEAAQRMQNPEVKKVSIPWLVDLARAWRRERSDAARPAYELLDAWWLRDAHLYDFQTGLRRGALNARKDAYRCLARRWASLYRTALLSDQDLSREARWGADADVRQQAGIYELRLAIENAFGEDAVKARWRDGRDARGGPPKPEGAAGGSGPDWCERTRDAWIPGGARDAWRFPIPKAKTTNAWASRKARKAEKLVEPSAARKPSGNLADVDGSCETG